MSDKITITMLEANNMFPALRSLASKEIKARPAYRIGKLLRKLTEDIQLFQEARNNLVKRLGEPTEADSEDYRVKDENLAEFQAEINTLLDEKIELDPATAQISLSDLDGIEVSPQVLAALDPILTED